MKLCDDLLTWLKAEFQQIYIFTLLVFLYYFIIHIIAAGEFELKPEVESLLNQGSGGIISMMTLVVQSIFTGKSRSGGQRASDGGQDPASPPLTTSTSPQPKEIMP